MKPVVGNQNVVEAIEFRGSRRVPQETLRGMIITRKGDVYNEDTFRRDFRRCGTRSASTISGWKPSPALQELSSAFVVTERPVVRTIKYEGAKSVTVSEILDRFKERKVGLSVESQYDPPKCSAPQWF